MATHNNTLLKLSNVKTYFYLDEGVLKALDGVNFAIARQKTLGVIGESGCGKSVTARSILRIVPPPGKTVEGEILFTLQNGETIDLTTLDPDGKRIRTIRGAEISMVFQEPMTSLSPVHTIGDQVSEVILVHRTRNKKEAKELTLDMLQKVGMSNPGQRYDEYPHQLSGGLRQRAMIAMALSCSPSLLIADEPTTALDVTVQAQILDLMRQLQEQIGMAMMYITHDLGVIADVADDVVVMYLGMEVEYADVRSIFHAPLHPYTRLLLKSIPKIGKKARTRLDAIEGSVPVPLNLPDECPFIERCPDVMEGVCNSAVPPFYEAEDGHLVRCYLYREKGVSHE